MPNHVSNILKVNGTPKQVEEVINILLNEEGGVTFDNFAPMPIELISSTSPTQIVSQEEYDKQKKELDEKLAKGEKVYSKSLPLTAEMQKDLIKKYEVDNWYDWAVQNWGTKWGAYDGYKIDDTTVFFQSAWSTPFNGMVTLSNKFPEVEIIVDYADEDFGYNVGQYTIKNGDVINENAPEGGSIEAIRMALDIQGGEDYYLGEIFDDIEVEEMGDKFYSNILLLGIENEVVDEDFPEHINNFFLEKAIENEQYEYASKLRDAMKIKN